MNKHVCDQNGTGSRENSLERPRRLLSVLLGLLLLNTFELLLKLILEWLLVRSTTMAIIHVDARRTLIRRPGTLLLV